jgi:hypothetical protein
MFQLARTVFLCSLVMGFVVLTGCQSPKPDEKKPMVVIDPAEKNGAAAVVAEQPAAENPKTADKTDTDKKIALAKPEAPAERQVLSPEGGGFIAVIPAGFSTPQKKVDLVDDNGKVPASKAPQKAERKEGEKEPIKREMVEYLYTKGPDTCRVIYADLPEKYNGVRSDLVKSDQMLDNAQLLVALKSGGDMLKPRDTIYQGSPRRSLTFATKDKDGTPLFNRVDIIIKRPRMYQVIYSSKDQAALDRPEVLSFFNTFRFH